MGGPPADTRIIPSIIHPFLLLYPQHHTTQTGALVYCRVAVANKDMDSELSCIGASAHNTNANTSTIHTPFNPSHAHAQ